MGLLSTMDPGTIVFRTQSRWALLPLLLLLLPLSHFSHVRLCVTDPVDGSPPGFPIPEVLKARTLEWVAISFSKAWKWKVKSEREVAQSCPTRTPPDAFLTQLGVCHQIPDTEFTFHQTAASLQIPYQIFLYKIFIYFGCTRFWLQHARSSSLARDWTQTPCTGQMES